MLCKTHLFHIYWTENLFDQFCIPVVHVLQQPYSSWNSWQDLYEHFLALPEWGLNGLKMVLFWCSNVSPPQWFLWNCWYCWHEMKWQAVFFYVEKITSVICKNLWGLMIILEWIVHFIHFDEISSARNTECMFLSLFLLPYLSGLSSRLCNYNMMLGKIV